MKIERDEFTPNQRFTPPMSKPEKITQAMVADYVARGRYLKSLYVVDLLRRVARPAKSVVFRIARRLGAACNRAYVRGKGLSTRDKGAVCKLRH